MISRVEQAQGAFDKALRDQRREASLLEKGASTTQTVREMEEKLRIAEAALAEAKTLESYTRVEAPFDGRITEKLVNAGDYAANGTPLFEIEGYGSLQLELVPNPSRRTKSAPAWKSVRRNTIHGILTEFSPAADSHHAPAWPGTIGKAFAHQFAPCSGRSHFEKSHPQNAFDLDRSSSYVDKRKTFYASSGPRKSGEPDKSYRA
jgi:hypothetical protein